MLPHERELVTKLEGKPFTLLGINTDESRSALKDIIAKEGINWPNIHDGPRGSGAICRQWNISGFPTIYVVDHEGVIRSREAAGALESAVTDLLAKVPSSPPP